MESKWISIKDRLPKEGTNVLTYPHYVIYLFGHDKENSWGHEGEWSSYSGVTPKPRFWMPLPEPPKN